MRKPPRWRLAAATSLLVLAACSSNPPKAGPGTPSGSGAATASASAPAPTPAAVPALPAVALVDWDATGSSYTLALVSGSAQVLASAHATWTRGARCGPVQAGIITPPPVSTSNSRAYYMDADGIKWLQEDGKTGVAFKGPLATNAFAAFGLAVAPDDSVFALNTIDYSQLPITQRITVTRVGASTLGTEIYSATSQAAGTAAVWPLGWRHGDLVLAYHRGTCTQGGGPGLADATAYHVVDATPADRKATIGTDSGAGCGLVGSPTPAGVACGNYLGIGDLQETKVLDWTGAVRASFGAYFLPGGLSPSGRSFLGSTAAGNQSALTLVRDQGNAVTVPVGECFACPVAWIDDSHFIVAPGTATPQVFTSLPDPLKGTAVPARGYPIARIPGSLD